jgi:hypothetical protein
VIETLDTTPFLSVLIYFTYIPYTLYHHETLTFYQNYLAMSNTADVISPSHSISGVNAINSLVAFYDIHGRTRKVLFFYFVPDTTRDIYFT